MSAIGVLLVGEDNPYGSDPGYALYPLPENASGDRLSKLLGLSHHEYLRAYDRVNLCSRRWGMAEARATAQNISMGGHWRVVLLGAKVCSAFGVPYAPLTLVRERYAVVPHPSGRNLFWNLPGNRARFTEFARSAQLLPGVPS